MCVRSDLEPLHDSAGPVLNPATDPLRLSAGRATDFAMRFGVLCRSLVQFRVFRLSVPLTSTPPKEHRCECQLTRAAPSTLPLRSAKLTTQNTFDWFDHDFSAKSSRALFRQLMLSASRPGHPFRGTQLPAFAKVIRSPKPATPRSVSPGPKPEESFTRGRCLFPISAID
jgi:hypothetical protein